MPDKKFLLIAPKNRSIYNFRGDLLKEIIKLGYEVVATGPDNINIEIIEGLGVRFVEIPLSKHGLNILGDLKYIWQLYNLIKHEKPDATLGYTIKPVIYGSMAARMAGVKNVNAMVTGVGYVFIADTLKAKLIRFVVLMLYRLGFSAAHTVIFQNPDDLEEFTNRKLLNKSKCKLVNGSGVNMEKFSPAPFPAQLTFLMIGRLLKSKGVQEYMQAARIVKQKHPEVRFMLLGALHENMHDSISRNELNDYITDGTIEYFEETKDVRPFIWQASVFVLPSYREGTPRSVVEAMAMARPLITTDSPGCRETVIHGKNGFLVPVSDSKAAAEKMEWFINNPAKLTEMGKESLKLCSEKFEVEKINKAMIKHLKL